MTFREPREFGRDRTSRAGGGRSRPHEQQRSPAAVPDTTAETIARIQVGSVRTGDPLPNRLVIVDAGIPYAPSPCPSRAPSSPA